jgi:sugar lactone lactonase YvrE
MPVRSRSVARSLVVAGLLVAIGAPGAAQARGRSHPPSRPAPPKIIKLPNDFHPEGIARDGTWLFSGSLLDGDIYRADLRTGEGSVLVDAPAGRLAVGMHADDRHRLFVAGGEGAAYVYDTRTGAALADYRLGAEGATVFINDVALTRDAAWFTDSFRPALFKVPLGRRGALPPTGSAAEELTVTGPAAAEQVAGFNFNGIVATPDGRSLIVVNYTTGALYKISAATGESVKLDLGGVTLANGDGLLLLGRKLWVVQNADARTNRIALVELSRDFTRGHLAGAITDPAFRIPTTVVDHGRDLYTVNARFDVAPPPGAGGTPRPDVDFEIVRVRQSDVAPLPAG